MAAVLFVVIVMMLLTTATPPGATHGGKEPPSPPPPPKAMDRPPEAPRGSGGTGKLWEQIRDQRAQIHDLYVQAKELREEIEEMMR